MKRTWMLSFIIAGSFVVSASADIMIVRGRQRGAITTNTLNIRAEYDVTEVGRGNMPKKAVEVLFKENTGTPALSSDVILILRGPSFSKNPDFGSYSLVSPDSAHGIIPYSSEAWTAVLKKTDEELSDAPESERLPAREAIGLLRKKLYEVYGNPRHIYFYPPRRVPYSWSLAALCVRNGAVKELKVRISDSGNIISETPSHYPIKFFDSTNVSAEEMELFVRDYHRNTPPDEWPTWDPEPPPSMSESAAEEHEASVPQPRDPEPMP